MKRKLALAAVAGMLAIGAQSAATSLTVPGPTVSSAAITPLTVQCRTGLSPVAVASTAGKPGQKVPFTMFVNNAVARHGWLTANRLGVFAIAGAVVDNHRNSVRLVLVNHVAVYGVVAPACTKPAAASVTSTRGSATSYVLNRNQNGTVTRWNPCDGDIRVRVNATKGGAGALADTQAALVTLSRATGLRFVYDGTTTFIPTRSNASSQPAKIVIAWAPPGTGVGKSDYYGAGAVGEGGWRSSGSSTNGGATWNWKIIQGFVVLDPSAAMAPGFGRGVTRGSLLLHELAHVAGLGHVNDGAQVMYPALRSTSYGTFGAGDLAGLKAVGATRGCTTAA